MALITVFSVLRLVKYGKRCKHLSRQKLFVESGHSLVKRITDREKIGFIRLDDLKMILPMEYDELHWKSREKCWVAKKNGKRFYFDNEFHEMFWLNMD